MRLTVVVLVVLLAVTVSGSSAQSPVAQWTEHLAINVTASPLDNVALRQGIASAIDRRAVFEAIRGRFPTWGTATGLAGSWFPPALPQHAPDVRIHPYDVAAARDLLTRAGFAGGTGLPEFELLFRSDYTYRPLVADVIRAQLAEVGIRVKPVGFPTRDAFFARVMPGPGRQGQYQIAVFAWGVIRQDDDFLSRMFLQGGPQNAYGYRNPDVTLLIADIMKETETAKRMAMLREAERLVLTDTPVVPLFYYYMRP